MSYVHHKKQLYIKKKTPTLHCCVESMLEGMLFIYLFYFVDCVAIYNFENVEYKNKYIISNLYTRSKSYCEASYKTFTTKVRKITSIKLSHIITTGLLCHNHTKQQYRITDKNCFGHIHISTFVIIHVHCR